MKVKSFIAHIVNIKQLGKKIFRYTYNPSIKVKCSNAHIVNIKLLRKVIFTNM